MDARGLVAALVAPATLAAALGAVWAAIRLGPVSRGWETLAVTVVLWAVVLWVWYLQRHLPLRADWSDWAQELPTDLAHATISAVAGATLARLAFFALFGLGAALVDARAPWPDHWPLLAQLALAVPIADLATYGFHRSAHALPWLWRLHEAHHASPVLYGLSSARAHPLYVALSTMASSGPLLALGMDPPPFALLSTFMGVFGLFQHANLALRTGPLDLVFATPRIHRWHHAADAAGQASNYGNLLSVWDRAFGTLRLPPGSPDIIGLGAPFPRGFLAHLAAPFRRA